MTDAAFVAKQITAGRALLANPDAEAIEAWCAAITAGLTDLDAEAFGTDTPSDPSSGLGDRSLTDPDDLRRFLEAQLHRLEHDLS